MFSPDRNSLRHVVLFLAAGLLAGGAFVSSAFALTLSGFSPLGGSANTEVTLKGSGFSPVTSVQFNGIGAWFQVVDDTTINTRVPSTGTTGPISLTAGATTVYSATNFFVGNQPWINSISPNGGSAGTAVTINGSSFSAITGVTFNGVNSSYVVNSTNQIVAVAPSGGATGDVIVHNLAGPSNGYYFYYPPTVASFAPAGATTGVTVHVYGTNLSITNTVRFNGTTATFNVVDNTHLTAYVPGGATSGPISVTSFAGTGSSSSSFFVGAPPTVSSVSPAGGPPGTIVTIDGSDFAGVTSVSIGGGNATFSVLSSTQIRATVPGTASTGALSVSNPSGTGTWTQSFYVGNAPVVSGFAPLLASVGNTVVVTGSGLAAATDVRFNGASATAFVANSDAQITATVPMAATNGHISIVNPAGTGTSVGSFSVAPRITGMLPSSVAASTAAGTMVSIAGDHFNGAFDVSFNGISAVFALVDDRSITAWVPQGATTGPVIVTTLSGSATGPAAFEVVSFSTPPHSPFATWPLAPDQNVPVVRATGNQYSQSACADSTGGAYVAWQDYRSGNWNIYLQRITAYGEIAPGWPVDGLPICALAGTHDSPKVLADLVGGVYVAWEDVRDGSQSYDIYCTRVTANGTIAYGWPASGRLVCGAQSDQQSPVLCTDAIGGAYVAWQDYRNWQWDIFVTRLLADGSFAPGWDASGVQVSSWNYNDYTPTLAPDGNGGAFVAWADQQNYANLSRVASSGLIAPGWPGGGIRITNFNSYQSLALVPDGLGNVILTAPYYSYAYALRFLGNATIDANWGGGSQFSSSYSLNRISATSDGQGGFLAAWEGSGQIYVVRYLQSGALANGWPWGGAALRNVGNSGSWPVIESDGYGGAIVTWQDNRSGRWDIYAQRIMANGSIASAWPANGAPVSYATGDQSDAVIVPSPIAGNIVVWQDRRNGNADLYTQNIGLSGKPGNLEPHVTSVSDVTNDQGGKLRIAWHASPLDTLPTAEIGTYGVWRLISGTQAVASMKRGAPLYKVTDAEVQPGVLRRERANAQDTWWEGVGSIPARAQATYSFVVSTLADSTSHARANEIYMVDAHANFGPYFWSSEPDSGHSVDNLAPATPTGLTAAFLPGSTQLHWHAVGDHDLARYEVHRGLSATFEVSPSTLVGTTSDTAFTDGSSGNAVYKLVAVDVHDNVSGPALTAPPAWLEASTPLPTELALSLPTPNPCATSAGLRLMLPKAAPVAAEVYDPAGRRVRTLVAGTLPAGEHAIAWNLTSDEGPRVAAGLYFVQVRAGSRNFLRRVIVLH